jgi:hypothetical protein
MSSTAASFAATCRTKPAAAPPTTGSILKIGSGSPLHNLLHAPLPLLFLGLVGLAGRNRRWGRKLRLFVAGCALHTAVDFLTHVDDGPLWAFPLDWHARLRAPVSYWDPAHHGRRVRLLEHLLDLLLLLVIMRKLRGYQFYAAREQGDAERRGGNRGTQRKNR